MKPELRSLLSGPIGLPSTFASDLREELGVRRVAEFAAHAAAFRRTVHSYAKTGGPRTQQPATAISFSGLAVPFEQLSNEIEDEGRWLRERFRRDAFDAPGALANVDLVVSHEQREIILASTAAGTLCVWAGRDGLHFGTSKLAGEWPRQIEREIDAGLIRGVSIQFGTRSASYDYGVRTVTDARLTHIAFARKPSYPQTKIAKETSNNSTRRT